MNIIRKIENFPTEKFISHREISTFNKGTYIFVGKHADEATASILKVCEKKNERLLKEYQNEVKLYHQLSGFIRMPKIIQWGEDDKYYWLIREYIEGKTLSSDHTAYDNIDEAFSDYGASIIKNVILEIREYQKTNFGLEIETKFTKKRFTTDLEQYLNQNNKHSIEYYNSSKQAYLAQPLKFCMGDLNPGNIVVMDDGKIAITDFSWACFDNQTMDFAYLWIFLWKHPDLQNNITNNLSDLEKNYFRLSIIRILVSFKLEDQTNLNYAERYKMWLGYLNAAVESFEALLKVKI